MLFCSTSDKQDNLFNFINVFHCIYRYFTHFSSTWPGKFWKNSETPSLLLPLREYGSSLLKYPTNKKVHKNRRENINTKYIKDKIKVQETVGN